MRIYRYHFLYKTTNLINGKYYYGRHSTNKLNDRYLGSGSGIKDAFKKYGRKNFKCEILEHFQSKEEVIEAERKLVTMDIVRNRQTYNQRPGGGSDYVPENTEETCKKISNTLKRKFASGELVNPFTGCSHPPEIIENIAKKRRGEIMITNGTHELFISKDVSIPTGWYRGRSEKIVEMFRNKTPEHIANLSLAATKSKLGKIRITNGTLCKLHDPSETIPDGWKRGVSNSTKERCSNNAIYQWVNNPPKTKSLNNA